MQMGVGDCRALEIAEAERVCFLLIQVWKNLGVNMESLIFQLM